MAKSRGKAGPLRVGKEGVLTLLQRRPGKGWLVAELVAATDLTQPTVSRHLKALQAEGRAEATLAARKSGQLRWKPAVAA